MGNNNSTPGTSTGRVKFFNQSKGFGFIIDNETGNDVFVHHSGVNGRAEIRENDNVSYDITEGKKGDQAVNVSRI